MKSFANTIIVNSVLHYTRLRIKALAIISPKHAAEFALKLFTTPRTKSKRSLQVPLLQQAQRIAIEYNGQTANLYYIKNENATKRILLVHGWESDSGFWKYYYPLLLASNYEIFALDAIAHGLSTGKSTNAIEYQQLISKILHEYAPFDALMAHSLGTLVSTFAVQETKNVDNIKLVLVSPAPYSQTHFNALQHILKLSPLVMDSLYSLVNNRLGMRINEYSIYDVIKNNLTIRMCIVHDTHDIPCPIAETRTLLTLNAPNVILHETQGLGHNKIAKVSAVSDIIMAYLNT
ncbi:MAG: alpha/beta hydrolase [Bacteroidia bacterium]|nr:alpha/beta hydrolase [Bacteroidia bacterium]